MYAELVGFFLSLGVSIIQSGQELHGKERFVADGLMTEGECQKLISLLEVRIMRCICYNKAMSLSVVLYIIEWSQMNTARLINE